MNAPRVKSMTDNLSSLPAQEEMWQAVLNRDTGSDGQFVYAVESTGIYCRPSCPSRRPLRKNVRFYESAKDADKASFRPCRRCDPQREDSPGEDAHWIDLVCRKLCSPEGAPSLSELAASVGLSPSHFHRRFKKSTGVSPKEYHLAVRSNRVREGLAQSTSVTSAMYDAGFNSNARFYASSLKMLGMTPSEYRRAGVGLKVRFAVGICSLGHVLVAATEIGLCAILLGDDPEELLRDLQDRFARADVVPGEKEFNTWVSQVVGYIDAPGSRLELPLDVQGTVFQRRAWKALSAIPLGSTATYSEIAQRLGDPKAARAVAGACAANPLAVAIPCHRVVRADGSFSGYRWGIARKKTLLERESSFKT